MTDSTRNELSPAELRQLDAQWRAANFLAVGQIYLLDNPLLKEPLEPRHIKPRLLGHWGTTPGLNFIYTHLNRAICQRDLNVLFVAGPGHGGPALNAQTWLEGSYSAMYPEVPRDQAGMRRLFRQFSFPGGIGSHVTPEVPGSLHEGGELGYALSHAFGSVFDNPDLIAACVIGDGEAETGPLAAAWHSNKFLNPASDGAVLPILHLNGYKIANPTLLARIDEAELMALLQGYGYAPVFVSGDEPMAVHQQMAAAIDAALEKVAAIQQAARSGQQAIERPAWPMLVLRTPKGWTGPKTVDGRRTEGSWRSHQVPLGGVRDNPAHLVQLEDWLRSYRPEELFDDQGQPQADVLGLMPSGDRRMGANPHANGGLLLTPLKLPPLAGFAPAVSAPGFGQAESTRILGGYLREVMRENLSARNFRVFGPDETASNRLGALFDFTGRRWIAQRDEDDDHLEADGRVMEILSEHTCQGWLEGYLLSGRHGFFSCYEAFIHIVDSMYNQHAKWLKIAAEVPWRRPIASVNLLLSSHVWRQDHNGFSHQDPGFIDHIVNKKAEVVRVYLPPDANTLLCVAQCCLASRNRINVIVAGKQPQPQWLGLEAAIRHCQAGLGIWDWASNDAGEPDVVLACAGDAPTLEILAATQILREHCPELRIRVINVVDLMCLQPQGEHPRGLSDAEFDALFTTDRPIVFAFHGYPWLIHRLCYRRRNHRNLHVRGYKEEGTTTTPFDMLVRNDMDRYHLVCDVIDRVPALGYRAAALRQAMRDALIDHRHHITEHGIDPPSILDWVWSLSATPP